jgi:hypothetical protein
MPGGLDIAVLGIGLCEDDGQSPPLGRRTVSGVWHCCKLNLFVLGWGLRRRRMEQLDGISQGRGKMGG